MSDESKRTIELGYGLRPGRTTVEILARAKYEQRLGIEAKWEEMSAPLPPEPSNATQHDRWVIEHAKRREAYWSWIDGVARERREIAIEIVTKGGDPKAAVKTADELLAILYTT